MKILFTGATGFVGSHIRSEIETVNNEILFLVPEGENLSAAGKNSKIIETNLRDIEKVKNKIKSFSPEVCIHCAWQGIPDYSEEISKLNLINSIKLVDFLFKETRCSKLVISGSCFEYGKTKGICRENKTGTPSQFFAWAKQSLYNYSNLMARNKGQSLIWFRMFYVYGPGQRKESLIPSLVSSFQKGEKPNINRPFNANDFIYMPDAAKAYKLAIEKDVFSGIYNIGSGISTRVIDICRLVEKKVSVTSSITDEINKECDRTQDVDFYADTSKMQRLLGWRTETSIEDGIVLYLNSMEDK